VDILTTPEMLQKAGYATAGVGKMAPLNAPVLQVRKTVAKLAQKLGQLQPFIAVFPQECTGRSASLGAT
jgi:hypothetical protein